MTCQQGTLTPPCPCILVCSYFFHFEHASVLSRFYLAGDHWRRFSSIQNDIDNLAWYRYIKLYYPPGYLVLSPLLGTCVCSNCWNQFFPNLPFLFSDILPCIPLDTFSILPRYNIFVVLSINLSQYVNNPVAYGCYSTTHWYLRKQCIAIATFMLSLSTRTHYITDLIGTW